MFICACLLVCVTLFCLLGICYMFFGPAFCYICLFICFICCILSLLNCTELPTWLLGLCTDLLVTWLLTCNGLVGWLAGWLVAHLAYWLCRYCPPPCAQP